MNRFLILQIENELTQICFQRSQFSRDLFTWTILIICMIIKVTSKECQNLEVRLEFFGRKLQIMLYVFIWRHIIQQHSLESYILNLRRSYFCLISRVTFVCLRANANFVCFRVEFEQALFRQVKLYFDIILYYMIDPERISVADEPVLTSFFIC